MHVTLPQNMPAWLADMTIQSTAILLIAWVALKLFSQSSAAHRCLIAGTALLAIPGAMALSILFPQWNFIQSAAPAPTPVAVWKIQATTAAPLPTAPTSPSQAPLALRHWSLSEWLTGIWLAGIGSIATGLVISAVRLRRLERDTVAAGDSEVLKVFIHLVNEAGLSPKRIRLLFAPQNRVPMTWGFTKARILLPIEATEWPQNRLELVLRHELAHISRRDTLWTPIVYLAGAVQWFHPGVWWMLRTFSREREGACDDLAMNRGGHDPITFAATLLDAISVCTVGSRPLLPLALCMAAGDKAAVKARLAAVLNHSRDRSTCSATRSIATMSLTAGIMFLAAGLSACRPIPVKDATPSVPEQRVYFLTDTQWERLTEVVQKPPQPAAAATPKSAAPQAVTTVTDLAIAALRIRTHFVEAGIPLTTTKAEEEVVRLKDERTLVVNATPAAQEQIAKYLSTLTVEAMLRIDMKVFQLPKDAALQSLGLAFEGGEVRQTALTQSQVGELLGKLKTMKEATFQGTPSVIVRSGKRASIEMVRELIYPTEWAPPELPPVPMKSETDSESPGAFPVTPTTPTAFEMRPIGVRAEFEPRLLSPAIIQLEFAPEVTVLEGFINYGSPITTTGRNILGTPVAITLTENRIPQPVFHTAKFSCSVILKVGESVVMGGLTTPQHDMWQDKRQPLGNDATSPGVTMNSELAERLSKTPEKIVFFIISADTVSQ